MDILKAEYEELIRKMKPNLPIKAYPMRELVSALRTKHLQLTLKSEFLIKDVMNSGDVGGIVCIIECDDIKQDEGLACSLTHVQIIKSEPLRNEIEKYQLKRAKRLNKQNKPGINLKEIIRAR